MDHLETFDPSRLQSLSVPYVCEPEFREDIIDDAQEFFLYPQTKRVTNGQYVNLKAVPMELKEFFFQNWLYFGFLRAIFSVQDLTFVREDFIRREGETSFITSRLLPQYLERWTRGERRRGEERRSARLQETKKILQVEQAMVCEIFSVQHLERLSSIVASIQAIAFSVASRMKQNWPHEFVGFPPTFGPGEIFLDQLEEQQWCPYDVNMLRTDFFVDAHYYCSTMPAPRGKLSHQSCSKWHCHAANIDENSYRTKHTEPDCSCEFINIPVHDLHDIVQRGIVPLVRYVPSNSDGFMRGVLQLVENDYKVPNVAISHVWSDGLGNTSGRNSLPACQLERLQQMANDAYDSHAPVAFYVDTLCVPRDTNYRALAIAKMRDVYKNAGKVLVLDSDIEKVSVSEGFTSVIVRIVLSGWARRLWTLQEGVLNSALYFKLRDCILPFERLDSWQSETRRDRSYDNESVGKGFSAVLHLSMRITSIEVVPQILSFAAVCDSVRWRTTSHDADETICLAVLLGKDPIPLLMADPSERMKMLLKSVGQVPIALLLLSGERLHQSGFTWAPKSLLGSEEHHHRTSMSTWYSNILRNNMGQSNFDDHRIADILPDGKLQFKASGFEVEVQGNDPFGPVFWVIENINAHDNVIAMSLGRYYRFSFFKDKDGFPLPLSQIKRFHIIFVDGKDFGRGTSNSGAALAIPESVIGSNPNETTNCTFYCRLQIGFVGRIQDVHSIEPYRNEVLREDRTTALFFARPLEGQDWCLA